MYSKLQLLFVKLTVFMLFFVLTANDTMANKIKADSEKNGDARLTAIFSKLEKETDYRFSYGSEIINDCHSYYVDNLNSKNIYALMDGLASEAGLNYRVNEKLIMVRKNEEVAPEKQEQKSTVASGKVVDEYGQSLPGVNIVEKETTNGTVTDINGEFKLELTDKSNIVVFSFIGYKNIETEAAKSMQIVMLLDQTGLEEVVVVGYGSQARKDVTGSISTIDAKNFKQGITTSADNLLQGKISGVRIINSSGEPGGRVNVQIRGVGSIRQGSSPLFVVDGVPLSNDATTPEAGNVFGSSAAKNPLNFLNTSDIESMTVLKDASAAAIYGARGSNGVVLITTKKGKEGNPLLTINSYLAVSNLPKKIDLLTADEYRNAIGESSSYNHGANTDWQDEVFRQAITKNLEMSFSKRTESGSYYVSAGHINQEGIIKNSSFERLSGRINAEESFFDNKRLVVKMNMALSQMNEDGVPSADNAGSDSQLITHMLMANPTHSVFDQNGAYTNFNLTQNFNPMYLLHIYEDETNTLRAVGNLEASLRLLNGLTYRINYALDKSVSERNSTIYRNYTVIQTNGKYAENHLSNTSELLEHYLTYELAKNNHKLNLMGGFSYQKFNYEATGFSIVGLNEKGVGIKPKYNPDYTSYTSSDISGGAQKNEIQSYFTRLNYDYNSRYMLTASLRADGSTRFGENKKYGYFPSFAAGWNISRESFMESATFVNNLKMRASWGQTGNQEVPNKITKPSYSLSSGSGYHIEESTVTNGISINRTANPDLHWEVVTQYNLGFDFTLFNNLLYGSVDYYNKTTTDAILYMPAPILSPTDYYWKNVDASIINKGIEFEIGCNIINNKNVQWSVDFNAATLDNVIKDLPVSEMYSGSISGPGQSGVMANIYKSGYEIGSFYLYNQIGFDENGKEIFEDTDIDGDIDSDDRTIVEGALPNFTYGINSNLSYKNFDFAFSIIGQKGAYLFNNTNFTAANINNLQSDRNSLQDYYSSGASTGNSPLISTYYLEKSDFIRLNSVRLGYTFNTSEIKWLSGVNVYVSGQNLFTITDYTGFDPLANADKASGGNQSVGIDYTSYPNARTFMFGLAMKF